MSIVHGQASGPSRIVVTGATGFLGSHIALALLEAGHEVIGAVRTPAKGAWLSARGVRMVAADLTDPASLVEAFRGADAVISNAAQGGNVGHGADMAQFERVNCQGIEDLFTAAKQAGVRRVVHISSTAVYRTRLWRAMTEDTAGYDTDKRRFNWSDLTTDWRYTKTKTLAERIAWQRAKADAIDLTTLRPGPIYGSRDEKATARLRASLAAKLKVVPTVGVPWVHAGDVAKAVVAALANPASIGKAYNMTGPAVPQYAFMAAMRDALRAKGEHAARLIPVPVPVWVRYDTSAAARDLAFAPRTLADGMREVFESS